MAKLPRNTASEIVNALSQFIDVFSAPRPVIKVMDDIIRYKSWDTGAESALEVAERLSNRCKDRVRRRLEESQEDGHFLVYVFNSSSDDYIQGSCYIEPQDDSILVESKIRRANTYKILEEFKSLTPNGFESLCKNALALLSVKNPILTQASADQGVDFFGQASFGELIQSSAMGPGVEKYLKIWMVGQAKHYQATQVSTKDIRELIGSVSLAKSKVYAGSSDPLKDLQMRVCDPVFFLFFTTGRISRDAKDLLKKSGVIAMDGEQLAMFLADNGVGISGRSFDSTLFHSWVHR